MNKGWFKNYKLSEKNRKERLKESEIQKSHLAENPFCNACQEENCCVQPDGTCEMIRVYFKGKVS